MIAARSLSPWQVHLLLLLSGAAITLSFAPFFQWWIAPLSCAALAFSLHECSASEGFRRGWSFGSGMFLAGTSWVYVSIHDYGYVPAPLAALITVVFCVGLGLLSGFTAWLFCRWVRHGLAGNVLGFAALWVLGEWLRGWLLTGFPWLYLGYAHVGSPLSGWAPVTGVLGLSFLVSLTAAALAIFLRQRRQWLPLMAAMVLSLMGISLSPWQWTQADSKPSLSVAAVQANITQDQKWLPSNYQPTLDLYRNMTEPLLGRYDLIIWPEAAIPAFYHQALDFFDPLAQQASDKGSTLITGVPYWGFNRIYNAVLALGNGEGRYNKQHLVPFGEYVPLHRWLGDLISLFELPMSNFSAGSDNQPNLLAGGYRLAPFVCYEIVFPEMVARQGRDANILLTVSNDAWFGRSFGPAQHMQMAQMRALENGKPLIRATSTGITAITDTRGRITHRVPSHQRQVLTGEVQPHTGLTPFARYGSTPVLLLCAGLLLIGQLRRTSP